MLGLSQKAREVLDRLTTAFDHPEDLIDTIAKATLIPNTSPCVRWAPSNRFLVAFAGTSDARGFRQWQEVNRRVKKGAKAIHILVPRHKKVEKDDEEHMILIGFVTAPVFRVEDTEGDPLPEMEPKETPKLQVVADTLGIPVRYTGAVSEKVLGLYHHQGKITLFTHDVATWYHELSHALHHRTGLLRISNDKADKRDNEIVAEIAAAVLVRLFEGTEMGHQAIQYIQSYHATKPRLLKLLPEIIQVVDLAISIADPVVQTAMPAAFDSAPVDLPAAL